MTFTDPSHPTDPYPPVVPPPTMPPYLSFVEEVRELVRRHGLDTAANTPDFIVASFLDKTLTAFVLAMQWRDQWDGARPLPPIQPMAGDTPANGQEEVS